jgi:hypothetical protein
MLLNTTNDTVTFALRGQISTGLRPYKRKTISKAYTPLHANSIQLTSNVSIITIFREFSRSNGFIVYTELNDAT